MAEETVKPDESTTTTPTPEQTPTPVETPPTPEVTTTETQAPPETPQFSVLESARQAGFPVDQYETDQDAFQAILQHTRSLESELINRQEPQPEPEPKGDEWSLDSHFESLWSVPQYDPSWEDTLTVNPQTGQIEAKPHVPWGVAQKAMADYTQYNSAHRKAMKGLFESGNPYKAMYEALKPAFEKEFAARDDINTALTSDKESAYVDQWLAQHSNWANTSRDFVAFDQLATQLHERGFAWPEALDIASAKFRPQPNQTKQVPQQTEQPPPRETPTEPAEKSMIEDAISKAGHNPSGSADSTPTSHSGPVDAASTRNLFKTRWQQSQAAK